MAPKPVPVPTSPIGYTQAPHYNWWLYENETTPELQWPQSIYVYDQMRRTDAQVASVLRAVTLPVRRTPWRIDPNGARPEVVQFVADDLGLPVAGETEVRTPLRSKNRFSWPEHLRLALLMLPFGHSYFEQLYRVDPDGSRAHLGKLEFRPQTTIERIDVATDGGLIAIKQYWTAKDSTPEPIPVDRLVAYVHEREGGNWLGTSILRNCYKNWLLKDRLLRVQAQTVERNGMGVPVYKAAESEQSLTPGQTLAQGFRSGENAGAAIPNGAELQLLGVSGTLPDADKPIRYHDEQIARAVLAHFLNLGSDNGSYALGATLGDFFVLSLQTLAMQIANTATQHIVEDLVDVNWGPDEPAPRLCFDEIGSRQQATAESLKSLVDAGILHPDAVLEGAARQYYGLPPADPATATLPPGQTVGETPPPETQTGDYSVAASAGVDLSDEASWIAAAAGMDTHPGGEQLKHYWVFGEGAALWVTWYELRDHLRKYLTGSKLARTVSAWYKLRYGHMPPHHGNPVHAGAEFDEPDLFAEFDDEADEWELAIDALCSALDELSGRVAAAFNPRQPRIPAGHPGGGRFLSMVEHLKGVLYDHVTHGGTGDPFEGFDREQLRRAAVKQGISLKRGESRDSIAKKLHDHLGGGSSGESAAPTGVLTGQHALEAARVHPSDAQRAALDRYGGDGGYVINSGLRVGHGSTDGLQPRHRVAVAEIDSLMTHSPLPHDVVVHRLVPVSRSQFGDRAGGDLTGVSWRDDAYVSTSVDDRSADARYQAISMRIVAPAGTPAISHETLDSDEILLGRGLTFRVVADHGKDDHFHRQLDVEVVPTVAPTQTNPRAAKLAERQSTAGQKAAGVGVRKPSKSAEARRKRIEDATNAALDESYRRTPRT